MFHVEHLLFGLLNSSSLRQRVCVRCAQHFDGFYSTLSKSSDHDVANRSADLDRVKFTDLTNVTKTRKDCSPRILDPDIAVQVASSISRKISRSSVIYHCHPGPTLMAIHCVKQQCYLLNHGIHVVHFLCTVTGPGHVLEELIKSGISNHLLAESNQDHIQYLRDVEERHPDCVLDVINNRNIQLFWCNKTLSDFVYSRVKPVAWQQEHSRDSFAVLLDEAIRSKFVFHPAPCISVIATLSLKREQDFVRKLSNALINQDPLFQHGRPEFFIFVTRLEFLKLCFQFPPHNLKVYHSVSAMFHLLWDAELLCKVKKTMFTPSPRQRPMKPSRMKLNFSDDDMYLVHLVPKASNPCEGLELPTLLVFLRQMLVKKHGRLIPKLESLVPRCGPRLINLGYGMLTEIGDVSPPEYLHIFKELVTWPEYQDSNLRHFIAESTSQYAYDDVSPTHVDFDTHDAVLPSDINPADTHDDGLSSQINLDCRNDKLPSHIDLDPHNDVLPSHIDLDTHNDVLPSHIDLDTHNDVLPLHIDLDTHNDVLPSHIDLDTHNDVLPSHFDLDTHNDILPSHIDLDTHNDALPSNFDLDTHNDALPSHIDLDTHNDVLPSHFDLDTHNDVLPSHIDLDTHNDALPSNFDLDTHNDVLPSHIDLDTHNDALPSNFDLDRQINSDGDHCTGTQSDTDDNNPVKRLTNHFEQPSSLDAQTRSLQQTDENIGQLSSNSIHQSVTNNGHLDLDLLADHAEVTKVHDNQSHCDDSVTESADNRYAVDSQHSNWSFNNLFRQLLKGGGSL